MNVVILFFIDFYFRLIWKLCNTWKRFMKFNFSRRKLFLEFNFDGFICKNTFAHVPYKEWIQIFSEMTLERIIFHLIFMMNFPKLFVWKTFRKGDLRFEMFILHESKLVMRFSTEWWQKVLYFDFGWVHAIGKFRNFQYN